VSRDNNHGSISASQTAGPAVSFFVAAHQHPSHTAGWSHTSAVSLLNQFANSTPIVSSLSSASRDRQRRQRRQLPGSFESTETVRHRVICVLFHSGVVITNHSCGLIRE